MSALPFADTKPLTYRVNLASPPDLKAYEAQDGYAALHKVVKEAPAEVTKAVKDAGIEPE